MFFLATATAIPIAEINRMMWTVRSAKKNGGGMGCERVGINSNVVCDFEY